jgi:hypothetical protein
MVQSSYSHTFPKANDVLTQGVNYFMNEFFRRVDRSRVKQRLEGIYLFHVQGQRIRQTRNQRKAGL